MIKKLLFALLLLNHNLFGAAGDVRLSYDPGTGGPFQNVTLSGTTLIRLNNTGAPTVASATGSGSVMFNNGPSATNMLITGTNEIDGAVIGTATWSGSNTFVKPVFTGTVVTLNLTLSGTFPPFFLSQNGGAGFGSEVNELHLSGSSSGNMLVMQNFNTSGVSAMTCDQPGTTNEIGAFGAGGNTGVRSVFIEASNIDVDSSGTTSATPFYLMQTTSYSGSTTFLQHIRLSFDTDGTFRLFPRASLIPSVTLSGASSALALDPPGGITSTVLSTYTLNSSATGANRSGFTINEVWSPTTSEGTFGHHEFDANITTSGTSNITTGGLPGGINAYQGAIALNGSGNVTSGAVYSAWVRNLNSGTISNAAYYHIRSPSSGTTSPIGNLWGVYIDPLKVTGVADAIAINQTGINDRNVFSGSLHSFSGNVALTTSGGTLSIKGGTNGMAGTVTLTAGAGVITSSAITTNTIIETSLKTPSGTSSKPQVTVFSGSATVTGLGTDNGTYNWVGFLLTP